MKASPGIQIFISLVLHNSEREEEVRVCRAPNPERKAKQLYHLVVVHVCVCADVVSLSIFPPELRPEHCML